MIEENGDSADATLLDNADFEQTDIPYDTLCIPVKPCVSGLLKEIAKEWVLAVSLDQHIEQVRLRFHITRDEDAKNKCFINNDSNCHWMSAEFTKPVLSTGRGRPMRLLLRAF